MVGFLDPCQEILHLSAPVPVALIIDHLARRGGAQAIQEFAIGRSGHGVSFPRRGRSGARNAWYLSFMIRPPPTASERRIVSACLARHQAGGSVTRVALFISPPASPAPARRAAARRR